MTPAIVAQIKRWGLELGFQQIGITDTDLSQYTARFSQWLAKNYHGQMRYMEAHGEKRHIPAKLVPGTIRVISARMNYLPPDNQIPKVLQNKLLGYISRYALGRDYHKIMRKRLQTLAEKISTEISPLGFRAFCDSAPVLEKPLAEKAGLGWIGKHTCLINKQAGSWFFLGEIYTDLPLPIDTPEIEDHCGRCTACITICPTQAIVAPYQLDARRRISYLTIELKEAIPLEYRSLIGNRIYGCDDCQLVCPWNRLAKFSDEKDFYPRKDLTAPELLTLFKWSEQEFLTYTEGSAIRRIGYDCWLRNIAIALGNAPYSPVIIDALKTRLPQVSDFVAEHIHWALTEQMLPEKNERIAKFISKQLNAAKPAD